MFDKYIGEWGFAQAAHLLRRTTYGPRKQNILDCVDMGLEATMDMLLTQRMDTEPPIYFDFEDDPEAGLGETWVGKNLDKDINGINTAREHSMISWYYGNMHDNGINISEKLFLFWHNHFVVSGGFSAEKTWAYIQLLRAYSLGNFKELTKKITINKAMLIYLNGSKNEADEPNENYARELLELFTIGKGPQVAPGDYSNYTEQDIAAFARALTGWSPWWDEYEEGYFRAAKHDDSDKQLSHRFGNQVIQGAGEEEYKKVIDIIFAKDEVAYHICRRLFIWFVHYDITPEIEANIIGPMAQLVIENNYEIKPALQALLSSTFFYSNAVVGAIIKNPLDYLFSITSVFGVDIPADKVGRYTFFWRWHGDFTKGGMEVLRAPSVAGWNAYHQSPIYYKDWINSGSLGIRLKMLQKFNWVYGDIDDSLKGFDFIRFIEGLENPTDVNDMIKEVCELIYPRPLSEAHLDFFKAVLLDELPDFEWTIEYNDYLNDPQNEDKKQSVENKLTQMFKTMMSIPEFQLS